MKKLVAFLTILFVSVLCTACINNFAVQELNNKAKEYLEAGDVQSAICRLQSSADLDANIYETRYNLAIAYIKNHDFKNAKEQIEFAMKLKPENADNYYSLGVINEGLAYDVLEPKVEKDKAEVDETKEVEEEAKPLNKKELELATLRLNEAVQAYEHYLVKNPEAIDKGQVNEQIDGIKNKIEQLNTEAQTAPEAPDTEPQA